VRNSKRVVQSDQRCGEGTLGSVNRNPTPPAHAGLSPSPHQEISASSPELGRSGPSHVSPVIVKAVASFQVDALE